MSLLDGGGDFDELAEQYSTIWDEENGAVLEVEEGTYSVVFEEFVFNSDVELNTVSDAIKDSEQSTKGGYWLYMVTDRDTREISEEHMDLLIGDALDEWIADFGEDGVVLAENIEDMKKMAAAKVSGS
ncbi:MAG: hypothetical protein GXX97_05300 [Dehalococcoidales bacterium]|nr:hypothetical protein [Dehalococcoidales bacterium]